MKIDFIKVGGSLLTDKSTPLTARFDQISSIAKVLAHHYKSSDKHIVIGTGGGSFGHYYAATLPHSAGTYNKDAAEQIHASVAKLNGYFTDALRKEGLDARSIPAAAFAQAESTGLIGDASGVMTLLQEHMIVSMYGDMVSGDQGWRVASTEKLFIHLAQQMKGFELNNCFLITNAEGVLDKDGRVIPVLQEELIDEHATAAYDVTGGMQSKVTYAKELAQNFSAVRIIDGRTEDALQAALTDESRGTRIH